MAKSLLNFLTEIQNQGVRTSNMFEIEISSGYPEVDMLLENVTMWGKNFTLPNRAQEYADVNFKGYPIPIPTKMTMEREHTLSVIADADGILRRAFLLWQGMVTDPAISDGSLFAGDKRPPANSFIRIRLLDQDMETVSETYKMVGIGVSQVGGYQVSNDDANVSTFDVQFKSVYWEIESSESPKGITR